jgi:hypothetical protein
MKGMYNLLMSDTRYALSVKLYDTLGFEPKNVPLRKISELYEYI